MFFVIYLENKIESDIWEKFLAASKTLPLTVLFEIIMYKNSLTLLLVYC
jgi:hypothetical protein